MSTVPTELAVGLRDALGLQAAVETGTFEGASTRLLAGTFARVWSIEWSAELVDRARVSLADLDNVRLVHGPTQDLIGSVAAAAGPALYWLDAHYAGPGTAGSGTDCPILTEIAAIDAAGHGAGSCLLIDDADIFLSPPPMPPGQKHPRYWPTLLETIDVLRARHDRHITVLGDVIVAVPPACAVVVDRWWHRAPASVQSVS
ncbi:hypothetical protein Val02_32110 [Virgisporangium aliadipatigenens]|uniref:Uncharacterized protein n=1 Tax=Virgisporangium aliadipatigenens TaxID=741659 RepID=A0A8J3YLV5_9ACTN|nr:hypothetical protein [Virgisporangium aliadipatigenens]GIJ46325.1 hypothetical protein Val02_32110 [Virgisporangium aliadipatigenens]